MGVRSSVERLADDDRARLHKMLRDPDVTQRDIAEALGLSKSAVNRHAVRMKRFAERNRQARELVKEYLACVGAEGQQEFSEVIVHQLRDVIYDLMLEIQTLQETPAEDDDGHVERVSKIAELITRASRSVRETETAADRSAERRRRLRAEAIQDAAKETREAARDAGLSDDIVDQLMTRVLGVR